MPETPDADLAGFVRAHDPDRFLCALFAPAAMRPALFALIACNHELARAREAASNPLAALIRLQWWRDTVAEAASGQPPRRHEVAAPLHAAIVAGRLDPAALTALIDAREAETAEDGFSTAAALAAHLRGTAGGLAVAAGRLLGAEGAALALLQALGASYGLAGVLRSVAAHAAQGRCLLPRDALAASGVSPEAVIARPDMAVPVVAAMAREGAERLRVHRSTAGTLPRSAIAAALPVVLAGRDLRRLAAGRPVPAPRGVGDRLAVTLRGLLGRL